MARNTSKNITTTDIDAEALGTVIANSVTSAVLAAFAALTEDQPAKTTAKAKPAKATKRTKAQVLAEATEHPYIDTKGNARVLLRRNGGIVGQREATKAERKALLAASKAHSDKARTKAKAEINTSLKAKGTKSERQIKVNGVWVDKAAWEQAKAGKKGTKQFLTQGTRTLYIAAAMEQDEEYLDAIREHFGLDAKVNPSTRQCVGYALDVELKVPGFKIGKGYKNLATRKA